jgi:hypothetical protein
VAEQVGLKERGNIMYSVSAIEPSQSISLIDGAGGSDLSTSTTSPQLFPSLSKTKDLPMDFAASDCKIPQISL